MNDLEIKAVAVVNGILHVFSDAESFRQFSMSNNKGYFAWVDKCEYHPEIKKYDPREDPLYKIIWGDGWYAIKDEDVEGYWLAPKRFYEENEHCPNSLSDFVEDITEELQDFFDSWCGNDALCIPPEEFDCTMESFITHPRFGCGPSADKILERNGFTVI